MFESCQWKNTELVELNDLTLGSERIVPEPGLINVCPESLFTQETHARSNSKLILATHLGVPYRSRPTVPLDGPDHKTYL